jgi:predicted CXXCH cytochrome family protein
MTLILVTIALLALGFAGTSQAFHDGGVAACEGCHTMHNSLGGVAMRTGGTLVQFQAGPYLLQGSTASEVCLNCHGTGATIDSFHISTEGTVSTTGLLPAQLTPGGDFSWIRTTVNSIGSAYGHNINAPAYGYVQDSRLTAAPGGTYGADKLGCQACHDPHGKTRRIVGDTYVTPSIGTAVLPIDTSGSYGASPSATVAVGAYRLLGGAGYTPKTSGVTFTADPPKAVAPNSYNRTDTAAAGPVRVAYGSGMSEWCANCHAGVKTSGYMSGQSGAGTRHPAGNDALLVGTADIAANYNAYVKSGDLSGSAATSYNTLVPYEEGTGASYATLLSHAGSSNAATTGPVAGANVMCLSCHRAHASAFASMTRYDLSSEKMTDATGAFTTRSGMSNAALTAAYYGRGDVSTTASWGLDQRILCNKCHAKD